MGQFLCDYIIIEMQNAPFFCQGLRFCSGTVMCLHVAVCIPNDPYGLFLNFFHFLYPSGSVPCISIHTSIDNAIAPADLAPSHCQNGRYVARVPMMDDMIMLRFILFLLLCYSYLGIIFFRKDLGQHFTECCCCFLRIWHLESNIWLCHVFSPPLA